MLWGDGAHLAGLWGWGETLSMSQPCSQCGAAGLARLHTHIYLFTDKIPQAGPRRAPAQQKYSKNASDHSSASAGPQASVAVLANLVCHYPWTLRSLQVAVPRCKAPVPQHGWVPCVTPGWHCGTPIMSEAFLSFFRDWEVLGLALFLLSLRGLCCCSVPLWRILEGGLSQVGSVCVC